MKSGRPWSDVEGYHPVDFSSLPVGPDFDLVDGTFRVELCIFAVNIYT